MTWNSKRPGNNPPGKDKEIIYDETFALWPKRTEEKIAVWLEKVKLSRKVFITIGGGRWWWDSDYGTKYHATDRQKAKHGLKW